jgi:hypothetical protein
MRLKRLLLCGLAALTLCGCAGYRLGPSTGVAAGDKSIQIGPFANRTLEPRLGDAVTSAMRKQIQRDGTFSLATRGNGDIVLAGEITRYHRQELSFLRDDLLTVRDYRVTLTAQVTARDRASGAVLLDQPVSGSTLLRIGADLTSAERQALPLLAEDLARNITALLADGSW